MDTSNNVYWDCIEYAESLIKQVLKERTCVVSIGGTTVARQDEFLVRELPESVTFSDRVTAAMGNSGASGTYRTEFNVAFEVWCKRATLQAASSTVLEWLQAVFAAVAADKTLGGLAIHAEPYMDNGGTAIDTNKTYTAAFNCGIHVKAEIFPATD